MQQLVITLSPQATAQYLKIATNKSNNEMDLDMDALGVQLDINMALMAGLCFADIGVNGQNITTETDDEDLAVELIEVN